MAHRASSWSIVAPSFPSQSSARGHRNDFWLHFGVRPLRHREGTTHPVDLSFFSVLSLPSSSGGTRLLQWTPPPPPLRSSRRWEHRRGRPHPPLKPLRHPLLPLARIIWRRRMARARARPRPYPLVAHPQQPPSPQTPQPFSTSRRPKCPSRPLPSFFFHRPSLGTGATSVRAALLTSQGEGAPPPRTTPASRQAAAVAATTARCRGKALARGPPLKPLADTPMSTRRFRI